MTTLLCPSSAITHWRSGMKQKASIKPIGMGPEIFIMLQMINIWKRNSIHFLFAFHLVTLRKKDRVSTIWVGKAGVCRWNLRLSNSLSPAIKTRRLGHLCLSTLIVTNYSEPQWRNIPLLSRSAHPPLVVNAFLWHQFEHLHKPGNVLYKSNFHMNCNDSKCR